MIKCFLLRSSVVCASWKCLRENFDDDTCVRVVYISSRVVHLLITLLTLDLHLYFASKIFSLQFSEGAQNPFAQFVIKILYYHAQKHRHTNMDMHKNLIKSKNDGEIKCQVE